jgi:hypothetical protein
MVPFLSLHGYQLPILFNEENALQLEALRLEVAAILLFSQSLQGLFYRLDLWSSTKDFPEGFLAVDFLLHIVAPN